MHQLTHDLPRLPRGWLRATVEEIERGMITQDQDAREFLSELRHIYGLG